ncbi:hypothetical protein RJ639_017815 [Escallonia herrerae]|uniref:Uncharacterized protein n=1 Tax=Escallonia herrerae TaxID=1293975 RepID=A0AA89AM09_9ASTE|nr:hypothetical protein RJ639_017815 [Escallonia herrerae]
MKPFNSVDHSKKYSSGLSSLLTRQDSDGDILRDSSGVLVFVEGAVEFFIFLTVKDTTLKNDKNTDKCDNSMN